MSLAASKTPGNWTYQALANPQVGDRFQWHSWWMYVVAVDDHYVTTLEAATPCTFPKDGRLRVWSREVFISCNYYQLLLVDRGNDVAGWVSE